MTSLSEEKINKSLEEIYLQDNNKIIKWLDEIKKPENQLRIMILQAFQTVLLYRWITLMLFVNIN